MPAELDRNDETGEAAVAAVGGSESMWHREGVGLPDGVGLDEALELGGLDWEVDKRKVYIRKDDEEPGDVGFAGHDRFQEAADCFVVVRLDRMEVLGQVGTTYTPIQNRDAFGALEPMLDGDLARIETCGSLRRGQDVWMLVRFDEERLLNRIGDEDPDAADRAGDMFEEIRPYGLITNNHAGARKVTLKETPVRVVCMNTLSSALSGQGDMTVEVIHSKNVEKNVRQAAEMLFGRLAARYGTVANVREVLRDTTLPEPAFDRLVLDPVVPVTHLEEKIRRGEGTAHTKTALRKAGRKRREIKTMWTKGEGHAGDQSAWEAYNGLVQVLDHSRTWEPNRSNSSRAKSEFSGKIGNSKSKVANRLVRFARADEDQREAMLA